VGRVAAAERAASKDVWYQQLEHLVMPGHISAVRKQTAALQVQMAQQLEEAASWEAQQNRIAMIKARQKAQAEAAAAQELMERSRNAWTEHRRQHILRGEMQLSEARARKDKAKRAAEAVLAAHLSHKHEAERQWARERSASMSRSLSKPVLKPMGSADGSSLRLPHAGTLPRPLSLSAIETARSIRALPPAARAATRARTALPISSRSRSLGAMLSEETPLGRLYASHASSSKLPTPMRTGASGRVGGKGGEKASSGPLPPISPVSPAPAAKCAPFR
jgi:hypothetical protein